jgi:hypothetical protein
MTQVRRKQERRTEWERGGYSGTEREIDKGTAASCGRLVQVAVRAVSELCLRTMLAIAASSHARAVQRVTAHCTVH